MSVLGGRTLDWLDDAIVMVDQTRLPASFDVIRIETVPELVGAIRRLSVRGAPAIGVAGAFGVALKNSCYTAGRSGDAFPVRLSPGQNYCFPAKKHYDCQTCTKTRYWAAK